MSVSVARPRRLEPAEIERAIVERNPGPLNKNPGRVNMDRKEGAEMVEEAEVLSIGSVVGGPTPENLPWNEAICFKFQGTSCNLSLRVYGRVASPRKTPY